MIEEDGRTVRVGGALGVRRRSKKHEHIVDTIRKREAQLGHILEWFHLSLMKCPDCGRNNVFCRPMAKEMKHVHVCYDCGYSKVEELEGLRAGRTPRHPRFHKSEIKKFDGLKKLDTKGTSEDLHDFDENGCCRMCQLSKPHESGKVADVSKAGEAGQADSQNPLRGRNPSRRNESSDRVSGSRMKAGATSGKCYRVHEADMRSWGSRLIDIVDRLGLFAKSVDSFTLNEIAEELDTIETEIWCYFTGLDKKVKTKFVPLK